MYRLYTSLVHEHDLQLVILAALVCASSVLSSLMTYRLALANDQRRRVWLLWAGLSLASGIWATHFVAMLAYTPPVPTTFNLELTALSLVVAAFATTIGLEIASRSGPTEPALGGCLIGLGIGAMHFIGMSAVEASGRIDWDTGLEAAALAIGAVLSAAAMLLFHRFRGGLGLVAAWALFVLAICGLHFTAMAGVTIVPDLSQPMATASVDRWLIAIFISGLTGICIAGGIIALVIDRLRTRISRQLVQLTAEVVERRRAEKEITSKQAALRSHQEAIANLMRDTEVRSGSVEAAIGRLIRALAKELQIDRVGAILLDRSHEKAALSKVYVATSDEFIVPEGFGEADHVDMLQRTSSQGIVTVEDTENEHPLHEFMKPFFERLGIRSVMHAPIIAHGEVVGFITCTNLCLKPRWTAEDQVLTIGVANLAALVLERHQRLELEASATASAARLARQQGLLNELIRSETLRTGNLEGLFDVLASTVARELAVDRVSIRLFSLPGHERVLTKVFTINDKSQPVQSKEVMPVYPSSFMDALASGPIVIEDCAVAPLTADMYESVMKPRHVRALLHAPIRNDGEEALVGVVGFSMYEKTHVWRPDDVLLATSVTNIIALAVERRRRLTIEEDLRQANLAAEEASRAKSMFLANMSHEIRTPMNGVLGMADLLSRSGLTARQKRLAGTITESARALLTIINDILDISRIEGGKLELERHEFDLPACVEDSVELLAEQASKKALDLNLLVDDAAVGLVTGDAVRLRQVLVNLIGNAIKFTEQGEITIHVGPAPGDALGLLRFTVMDTGIGIESEVQARLFRPFSQADTSISRRFGGTGLGLSISRHLVEMMGGRMELESSKGNGTRIWFDLPLKVRNPMTDEVQDQEWLVGRKVLVVDDRATNREIISSYLAASGAVIAAEDCMADGLATLVAAAAAQEPFDLAIVDLVMENGDGLDLARRIRATPSIANVRIILLSSMSWAGDIEEVIGAGVDLMLTKPIRRADLVAGAVECLSTSDKEAGNDRQRPNGERRKLGLKVLVAEDNPVNQVVAQEYLVKLGCQVTMTENGMEALTAAQRGSFDVILMDCQMPELDGYTATERLRKRERSSGSPPIPIIAVTANAFEADRQRCLAAGMTSYISKPYSEAELVAALSQCCSEKIAAAAAMVGQDRRKRRRRRSDEIPAGSATERRSGPAQPADQPGPEAGLGASSTLPAAVKAGKGKRKASRTKDGGQPVATIPSLRPELMAKLLPTYVKHARKCVATLKTAFADGDCAAIALVAHSLKSSSANVGEAPASTACRELEMAARNNDLASCGPLIEQVGEMLAAHEEIRQMFERAAKAS